MNTTLKKLIFGASLGATALAGAVTPAAARPYDRGDGAALAIGAGILGLAVGAAIADRGDRYYYDRDYYAARHYVTIPDRPGYYYYYEGRPSVYYHDRYYNRYYAPYVREHYRGGRYYAPPPPPYRGERWHRGW